MKRLTQTLAAIASLGALITGLGTSCGGDEPATVGAGGTGATLADDGTTCQDAGACASGFCVDGVCCAQTCDVCFACDVSGSEGTCTARAAAEADPQCANGVCDGAGQCTTGALAWVHAYAAGGSMSAVAVDLNDNVVVAGSANAAFQIGSDSIVHGASSDVFVAKLSPGGVPIWARGFAGSGAEEPTAVATDSAAAVVMGGLMYNSSAVSFGGPTHSVAPGDMDVFLAKFSATGQYQWSMPGGVTSTSASGAVAVMTDLIVDQEDRVIVSGGAGYSAQTAQYTLFGQQFDAVNGSGWIAAFDNSLNLQWLKAYPNCVITRLAPGPNGTIVATGSLSGPSDIGGGLTTPYGTRDMFLMMLTSTGSFGWFRQFGNPGAIPWPSGLTVMPDGTTALVAQTDGVVDLGGGPLDGTGTLLVAHFGALGVHMWSRRSNGTGFHYGNVPVGGTDGNVTVLGQFTGTMDFGGPPVQTAGGFDMFMARFGANGEPLWSRSFGDASDQNFADGVRDTNGNIIAVGGLQGAADFGAGPVVSSASQDALVAKFAQ